MFHEIRQRVKEQCPLIHCITNPISIRECANTILAVGGRPMMAEHPKEVDCVTRSAKAVMLNLGNITDVRMESMKISAAEAKKRGIPFVLDICGAAGLAFRRNYALELMREAMPTVIKGNYSEMNALYDEAYHSSGVDADGQLSVDRMEEVVVRLAREYHTVILASGKTDLVTDGGQLVRIQNGTPQLAMLTGTGCMQGALCAAFLSVAPGMEAAQAACAMLGICGELAETKEGMGTFAVRFQDRLSTIADEELERRLRLETVGL